jgi:hypothetical protein
MMNERRKSDKPVLPMKSSNKAGPPVAERMEGRGLTKGKPQQQNASRTPSRSDAPSALERIRQAAKKDKEMRFTALFHQGLNPVTAYLLQQIQPICFAPARTWVNTYRVGAPRKLACSSR